MNDVLNISDVAFQWGGRAAFGLTVPRLSLKAGESALLLGESGSGKSTLLSMICGTILPQSGTVTVAGTDLATLSSGARDQYRAEQIGVIFQQFNLLPFGSIADNILLPLRFAPERRKRAGEVRAEAQRLCQALGLPDATFTARANTLSVGQQQRVAVARALIGQPPLILADEPTSALDEGSQNAFLDLLFAQTEANNTALLMVSHDPRLADRFDRVIQISDIAQVTRAAA